MSKSGRLPGILGVLGVALVFVGVVLLLTEASLLRYATDSDFSGIACGAPLDNPGWSTGSPCHGVVNRQTAMAWSAVANGIGVFVAATILIAQAAHTPSQTATNWKPATVAE